MTSFAGCFLPDQLSKGVMTYPQASLCNGMTGPSFLPSRVRAIQNDIGSPDGKEKKPASIACTRLCPKCHCDERMEDCRVVGSPGAMPRILGLCRPYLLDFLGVSLAHPLEGFLPVYPPIPPEDPHPERGRVVATHTHCTKEQPIWRFFQGLHVQYFLLFLEGKKKPQAQRLIAPVADCWSSGCSILSMAFPVL